MFRRVLSLILALAANLKFLNLDPERVRELILSGLEALKATAAATPTVWDDLAISAAVALVKSDLWATLWKLIQADNATVPATAFEVADLKDELAAAFPRIAASVAA